MAGKIQLIEDDGWLEPYEKEINERLAYFSDRLKRIKKNYGSLKKFADADKYFGFNFDSEKKGWNYREWAPNAEHLSLVGDFNDWNGESHPLVKNDSGVWEIFISDSAGKKLRHEDRVKVRITANGITRDRIPAYIERTIQDPETYDFSGQLWDPKPKFKWTDKGFNPNELGAPIIYECHPGMAQEKEGVGTYREFADNVLPRVIELGYNCIQLMAIKEHPYYGSFGYHVSSFFAPSSRFGTPEDLKYLVNKAHESGIAVIMDMVHSHAVKNIAEGLNDFDGSDNQYFHKGGRGYHSGWDSKLFDYGREEVLRFLISNVAYWLKEFHFGGYRFDGVTSLMYMHHGDHVSFDHYDKYFKEMVDWDAICYLQLANETIHTIRPGAITIAEDMSGMPGICRKIEDGGIGFDYRLGMGIPDYWIKLLKHTKDEDWDIHELWGVMTNRRFKEKTIGYAESHDQALVGDKTIAFQLMDKEMYWHMSAGDENLVISRGIALHKLIRLFTASLGGEGYLNFIGNEFGHPEWVDFPREGNDWSYKYSRRQWSLVDNKKLKYKFLNDFDRDMIHLLKNEKVLDADQAKQLNMDTTNKVVIFERKNLLFLFNFHTSNSIPDYKFYTPNPGKYKIILNSDDEEYGGFSRVDDNTDFDSFKDSDVKGDYLSVYLPNRVAMVLKRIS